MLNDIEEIDMTFREKMLWVSMVAVTAIWGAYLVDVGWLLARGVVDAGQAYGGFIKSVILVVGVQVAATIVLAIMTPDDANAPTDVRDRDFAATAAVPAYTVLSLLIVMIMLAMPLIVAAAPRWLSGPPETVNAVVIGNALLLALVLAHLVDCGAQLWRYRREG
ncbi:hypothetical protein [Sphingomonas sp. 28-62-11]|uniref:hypothetical protein n=1 Tax=Sphingomonas sp. 28-62-11 TaxID=1970432 RepID=UPI000BDB08AA|nr:MAG: hypothetical protein B7Y49_10240 [Sphingomonas sp. 28-62-11]